MVVCSHPQVDRHHYQLAINHTNTNYNNASSSIVQARMCRNLRYSLGHLKSRDKQTYLAILDSIVMGPSHISANEAEALLNINSYLFKWVMW